MDLNHVPAEKKKNLSDLSEISRVISSRGMQEEVKNLQAYMDKHFSRQEILMEDWKTAGVESWSHEKGLQQRQHDTTDR